MAYGGFVAAKSVTGIGTLNIPGAQALARSAFFMPMFYGGLCGSAPARRSSEYGSSNPVQSATLLLGTNGGSSQPFSEDAYHV